jgi:GT2 family glycosyltransferase/glycosyltransferase involved in cell wall biosynthesis
MTARVTVVVPVHATGEDNLLDVRRCLESVLRHAGPATAPFDLLVIDDASPHGDIGQLVADLAPPPHLSPTFVRHPANVGFVASANEGFAASEGDIVLLNSDTVVTEGWLDRLVATAGAHPQVATVTPLTNAGSICTLPDDLRAAFELDGPAPRIDECARFVADHTLGLQPSVISGVGFCMLVSRAALDACGGFDEEAFGRGYGEEVDFCLRASARGFDHRVEDATFVYHREGGSFGASRQEAMSRASTLLRQRHPGFKQANRRERANDPLAPVFANLRAATSPRDPARPHVLHLLHAPSRFGGTEMQVHALADALRDGTDTSILHPSAEGFVLHSRWRSPDGRDHVTTRLLPGPRGAGDHDPDHPTEPDAAAEPTREPPTSLSALQMARDLLGPSAVHIHNLIGHPLDTLVELADFPGPVVCSIHDLYLACPNHSLLYRGISSCGIPDDLDVCDTCLAETRGLGRADLEAHRATVSAGLPSVDHWVVFSQASADHLLRAYPIPPDRLHLIPHGTLVEGRPPPLDERHLLDDPLEVAFVGRGWAKKGLDLVNRAAERLADNPRVRLHHFGELRDRLSRHVTAHGAYENDQLSDLLHTAGIGVILLPGPYAETFGFVMSEALQAGIPVIGPYYGAIGERIREHDTGWTIDPDDELSLPTLLTDLDRCRLEVVRAARRTRTVQPDPIAGSARRYADLYRPTAEPEDGTPA